MYHVVAFFACERCADQQTWWSFSLTMNLCRRWLEWCISCHPTDGLEEQRYHGNIGMQLAEPQWWRSSLMELQLVFLGPGIVHHCHESIGMVRTKIGHTPFTAIHRQYMKGRMQDSSYHRDIILANHAAFVFRNKSQEVVPRDKHVEHHLVEICPSCIVQKFLTASW